GCARADIRRTRLPLPWFRRKKPPVTEAPDAAASEHLEVETLTVDEPAEDGGTDGESSTTPKKRRRGTRGGRNRKRKTAPAVAAPPAGEGKKAPEPKPRERARQQPRPR